MSDVLFRLANLTNLSPEQTLPGGGKGIEGALSVLRIDYELFELCEMTYVANHTQLDKLSFLHIGGKPGNK